GRRRGGNPPRRGARLPARPDDEPRGDAGLDAGRPVERDRLADAEAAGGRRHRRRALPPPADPRRPAARAASRPALVPSCGNARLKGESGAEARARLALTTTRQESRRRGEPSKSPRISSTSRPHDAKNAGSPAGSQARALNTAAASRRPSERRYSKRAFPTFLRAAGLHPSRSRSRASLPAGPSGTPTAPPPPPLVPD